jgi:SAM-dependent methyltransferase
MPRFESSEIRRYYDRHTPAFIRFGQGGSAGAIHRAVWGPGVATRQQAFHYVDDRIAGLLGARDSKLGTRDSSGPDGLHVVDLGCGVGASLCYLAERLPLRGTGVTLSPVQARLAAERISEAGLSDRVECLVGDFNALPASLGPADLAYAIESFVHGPSPDRFFAECRRLIRPGGLLVICDDITRSPAEPAARRTIERFCRGWHVNTLLDQPALRAQAREAGFEHESTTDLTPYLEIRRPRDRVIDALGALFGGLPVVRDRFGYLIGGSALQTCLARGWIGYDLTQFRRLST